MNQRPLPSPPTPEQLRAADPGLSAFVAASAGSGKTQVLTDRVIRLLLAGAKAERILCITYTKAAAGEMANRVIERLADMATASAERRLRTLRRLLDRDPRPDERERALRLFADVLDAPGGLKIETIHAFCQSVLRRFPVEAELAPHFSVIDERTAAELMAEAKRGVMRRGLNDPRLAAAIGLLTDRTHETQIDGLMAALAGSSGKLAAAYQDHDGRDGLIRHIRALLGVGAAETAETIRRDWVVDPRLDEPGLRRAARVLIEHGAKGAVERGTRLAAFLAAGEAARVADADVYLDLWLTAARAPRADSTLWSKEALIADAGIAEILLAERDRMHAQWLRLCALETAEATAALILVADRMLDAYERLKAARAALDYDDLIARTVALLSTPGRAPWVLYKLDGGLDHVLIDEAQDTNYPQWSIVRHLTEEFFAGEGGAGAAGRSLFAVGDIKQSIYSFQGADPEAFGAANALFERRVRQARRDWANLHLDRSFRSTRAVLEAVDAVVNRTSAADGLGLVQGAPLRHQVTRSEDGGLVELWPMVEVETAGTPEPWRPPVEPEPGESPKTVLARQIARRIERMVGREILESGGRPIRPGDILVLVRSRDALVEELIRQLKERQVPVAGRDRLLLTDHLAVMDLIALGEAMLLPDDDLVLATLLKSPLVGYDEEALFRLAHGRDESLWARLRRAAQAAPESLDGRAFALLQDLRARVDLLSPFAFFDQVLNDTRDPASPDRTGASGRARLIARLGFDAADPIDEFLSLAQSEERSYPPSLQGFLFRLRTSDIEIKRELEQGGADAVRVMTVHGAKGLQAPIVFLPDTVTYPADRDPVRWFVRDGAAPVPLWLRDKSRDAPLCAEAREQGRRLTRQEYNRLLYVAMTRAEDRLYIAGAAGRTSANDSCWYRLVERGLDGLLEEAEDPELGRVRRLVCPQLRLPLGPGAPSGQPLPEPLPDWARRLAPPEPRPPRPLAPSRPDEPDAPVRPPSPFRLNQSGDPSQPPARGWGVAAHLLLQRLPEIAPARRRAAALGHLARVHEGWPETVRTVLADEVLAILDHPDFAALFGPGSLAEAPLVAVLDDGRVVAGQVDRLLVGEGEVLVVDYKTNRRPPASLDAVPRIYLRQMAAYRAALSRMFPGRAIACALLWTDGPAMMPLPAEMLDLALPHAALQRPQLDPGGGGS
ncbi:MAG: double-strand break repair helicase AddA [Alphaproteobacteria bacterium]